MADIGNEYHSVENGKKLKEYYTWGEMIRRCCKEEYKKRYPTYKDIVCCDEWLSYKNFYEWLHSQSNFDKWHDNKRWTLDKDIIKKRNKIYSPDTCCLVPMYVNNLFTKSNSTRGDLPIGVYKQFEKYISLCGNPFIKKQKYLGSYNTPEEAFEAYKEYKENIIKQVAQKEFDAGNITKICYDAMMRYEVEIDD